MGLVHVYRALTIILIKGFEKKNEGNNEIRMVQLECSLGIEYYIGVKKIFSFILKKI